MDEEGGIVRAVICGGDGGIIAEGRLIVEDGLATFDRIQTDEAHRRRGLGRRVMKALVATAVRSGAGTGMLVATPMGRALYESIGWHVRSDYTSAVIPADG